MKKYLSTLCAAVLTVSFVSCGESKEKKPDYMSDTFYNAGIKFIDIVDKTIDVEIDLTTACDEIKYYEKIIDEYITSETDDSTGDSTILLIQAITRGMYMDLLLAESKYQVDSIPPSNFFNELLEDRNKIAEYFNLEKR